MIIGSHWLHPDRQTYGRASFSVELLYLDEDWHETIDRCQMVFNKGSQVALRVDWSRGQSLPPEGDEPAVQHYVEMCQAVAADPVMRWVTWMICGNEPNMAVENQQMGRGMQAWWPARVVFGHTRPSEQTDNVYQYVRTVSPSIQVLLPAVAPYSPETDGGRPMPEFPSDSMMREMWAPWETYQHDLMVCAYDNNWHADLGEIKTAVHTYGSPSIEQYGAQEPWNDVREGTYQAQFGTRWWQDCLYLLKEAQESVYNSGWAVWHLVTESNILRGRGSDQPEQTPQDHYPDGWWREVARYGATQPNCMGLAAFVDQDYGGNWLRTAMTSGEGRCPVWDNDHDALLAEGI